MHRETIDDPPDRSDLARRATEALERLACTAGRELDRHAGDFGLSDAKLEVLEVLCCRPSAAPASTRWATSSA